MTARAHRLHPRVEAVLEYFGLREREDAGHRRADWWLLMLPALLGIAAGEVLESAAPVGVGAAVSVVLAARAVQRLRRDAASLREGG